MCHNSMTAFRTICHTSRTEPRTICQPWQENNLLPILPYFQLNPRLLMAAEMVDVHAGVVAPRYHPVSRGGGIQAEARTLGSPGMPAC